MKDKDPNRRSKPGERIQMSATDLFRVAKHLEAIKERIIAERLTREKAVAIIVERMAEAGEKLEVRHLTVSHLCRVNEPVFGSKAWPVRPLRAVSRRRRRPTRYDRLIAEALVAVIASLPADPILESHAKRLAAVFPPPEGLFEEEGGQ